MIGKPNSKAMHGIPPLSALCWEDFTLEKMGADICERKARLFFDHKYLAEMGQKASSAAEM